MNLLQPEAIRLAEDLKIGMGDLADRDVAVFPTFVSVAAVAGVLGDSPIRVGGQDCHERSCGAYTGAVSAPILRSAGATLVILGHSERRHVFGEGDAVVKEKLHAALENRLDPVLCAGETLEERDAGRTLEVVERQVRAGLSGLDSDALARVTVAYEPVWAIGTGRTATPDQAQEVHAAIRALLRELAGSRGSDLRILYGGSVKPDNVDGLMAMDDIDGALVGGASLKAEDFIRIVRFRA